MDKITGKNSNRKFKLGMHSYTLHLSGYGESWGFQSEGKTYAFEKAGSLIDLMDLAKKEHIEVLHITLVDLDNDTSPEHLAMVKKEAEKRGLDLELNISFDAPSASIRPLRNPWKLPMLWGPNSSNTARIFVIPALSHMHACHRKPWNR